MKEPNVPRRPIDRFTLLSIIGLVVLSLVTLWATSELPVGSLRAMGPGMLPRALALLILGCAAILAVQMVRSPGQATARAQWRSIFFIVLAIIAFSLTIRTVGLLVAGPLALVTSGFASKDVRITELLVFAVAMTGASALLFRWGLGLPMPILIIPGVVHW